ncbi:hypothetical protein UG55_1005312 [Frankia sp. EI5c]|uniref:hypothetical protein n=1 Tax=Frankia sp. EI5c TaxID=683316 RepID=UPI0007C26CD8|nr:hypothetical protein [Frankia sp. EI5c]OAA28792.1 hypothetical protein UG55_1005312 [Frankia sp. EI5c]
MEARRRGAASGNHDHARIDHARIDHAGLAWVGWTDGAAAAQRRDRPRAETFGAGSRGALGERTGPGGATWSGAPPGRGGGEQPSGLGGSGPPGCPDRLG